ncbi:aromatic ring-hydroxylating dioxygenase subunit alpha [Nonomuraea sp. NPDC050643]|uniref:aromatic ring-hydroxylating dioxygenase subunit alpha n=1 Tax=Nonomuraea sp. NPDC050643 TaxID=3155660 RepID=UPI0033E9C6EA
MMDPRERTLLEGTWFPVARSEDLTGGVIAGNILGRALVVYRVDGVTTVADAACPHRGAALPMGRIREGALECPYHGWLFSAGSGRCVEVPSLPEGARPPRVALRTYPTRETYGHVWACLGEPVLPLPTLADWAVPGWQYGFGVPTDLACGMRQLTENFRDMAHFPFVHTETMGHNVRREVAPYHVERDGYELRWTLGTDLGGSALNGNTPLATGQTLTYHLALPMFTYIRTRFPDGGRRLVAQFATPITADGDRVRQFWVVGIDEVVATTHGVSIEEMWEYERQIFAEDHPIVENQWPAEAPLDVHAQAHTRADRYGIVYRQVYLELLDRLVREPSLTGGASR